MCISHSEPGAAKTRNRSTRRSSQRATTAQSNRAIVLPWSSRQSWYGSRSASLSKVPSILSRAAEMGRRGAHEGTIRGRPDGRWEARYRTPDGRQRSVFAKTQDEVVVKLRAALTSADAGLPVLDQRV